MWVLGTESGFSVRAVFLATVPSVRFLVSFLLSQYVAVISEIAAVIFLSQFLEEQKLKNSPRQEGGEVRRRSKEGGREEGGTERRKEGVQGNIQMDYCPSTPKSRNKFRVLLQSKAIYCAFPWKWENQLKHLRTFTVLRFCGFHLKKKQIFLFFNAHNKPTTNCNKG